MAVVVVMGRVLESTANRMPSIFLSSTYNRQMWAVLAAEGMGGRSCVTPCFLEGEGMDSGN